MIESIEQVEQQTNGGIVPTRKKRTVKTKVVAPRETQRIGIELDDTITAEVDTYCAEHPKLSRVVVRDAVREEARLAATTAIAGTIDKIVRKALFG